MPVERPEPPEKTRAEPAGVDLPPHFWDDAPLSADEAGAEPPEGEDQAGELEADPRFAVLQHLFPGRLVEWQEAGADESDTTEETVQETLNLGSDSGDAEATA